MRFLLPAIRNVSSRPHPWLFVPDRLPIVCSPGVSWLIHGRRRLTTALTGKQTPAETITLRPYQEESIQCVLDYLAKGENRLGISLATGSGKTVIFSHLIDRIPAPKEHATQTLVLAHREELITQAASHCRNLYPDKEVEIELGRQKASGLADITLASVQSLNSGDRLSKFDPSKFKLVLVDEAHHVTAKSYLDILRHFGLVDARQKSPIALVGVSATFSRHDGLSLDQAIDHIVYHRDWIDMIEDDWLANAIFTTVWSGADLSRVKKIGGDFQTGALSKAVNSAETNAITVRSWLEKAPKRKSTLVFCVDLVHVKSLTDMFRQHGVDARYITGNTKMNIREERLAAFKAGEFPVLLNCSIFTEGTDIPNIDCIVLARPTSSRNLLIQMIGRGLRKCQGKENCHVIDMVASLRTGVVTTPTLFGLAPDEVFTIADAKEMKDLKERKEKQRERELQAASAPGERTAMTDISGNVIFTHYKNVHELIEDTSGERHIRAQSQFAWVQIDDNCYILSNRNGDFITLKPLKELYEVLFYQRLLGLPSDRRSKSPYMTPRRIGVGATFGAGLRAADTFATKKFAFEFVWKNAPWRKMKASESQITFLNSFRMDDEKLEPGSITKGNAGDWITKIKHGARGRFSRFQSLKKKAEKEERHRRGRAPVKVGPLRG